VFEDYLMPPGAQGSQLIVLEFWQDAEWSYSAYIRCRGSQYFFEGKMRGSKKYSRHIYFPRPGWQMISLGDRDKCIKFIDQILPAYNCPARILSTLLKEVRAWREK